MPSSISATFGTRNTLTTFPKEIQEKILEQVWDTLFFPLSYIKSICPTIYLNTVKYENRVIEQHKLHLQIMKEIDEQLVKNFIKIVYTGRKKKIIIPKLHRTN